MKSGEGTVVICTGKAWPRRVSIRVGKVLRGKGKAKLRTAKWRNVKRLKGIEVRGVVNRRCVMVTRSEMKKCMSLVSYCVDELRSGDASRCLGIAR